MAKVIHFILMEKFDHTYRCSIWQMVLIYTALFLSWLPLKALHSTVLPFTHTFIRTMCSTFFHCMHSCQEQYGLQYFSQGHFGTWNRETGIKLLTFWLEDDLLYQLSHSHTWIYMYIYAVFSRLLSIPFRNSMLGEIAFSRITSYSQTRYW